MAPIDIQRDFDTRPRAVKHWLDTLPIAHIGETARKLYTALRIVNQQEDIPVKHLFNLLEGIAEPLNMILPELHRHYVGKPLPLSRKRRKVADLYTQLLHQAIQAYQQVSARAIELNRFGWKRLVTTSLHRVFHYSGLMLLNHKLLYLPLPKGWWQQQYWLYQMAENYKLLNIKILSRQFPGSKTTIQAEFTRLLLQSLLAPNLFKPRELEEVLDNMDNWIKQVRISHMRNGEQDQIYAFTLDTDIAPGLMANKINIGENPAIEVRYLSLSPLLAYLNRQLEDARPGTETISLTRQHSVSRRSLILLLNNWGRPPSRDGERRLIQGQAEVAIGISAIHYVISEGRHAQPQPARPQHPAVIETPDSFFTLQSDTQTAGESLASLGFTTDREVQTDIWESVYFEPEPAAPAWTESIRMKVYSYLNAKVLNISKGGFCIALPQDGVEHIQTSELVAIRGKRGEWLLGEIRWLLCPENAPIRAGIQKHSQAIRPALLHVQSKDNQAQPIKCLVGRNDSGKILFLPNLPFSLKGKKTVLEISGNKRRFDLLEQYFVTTVGRASYFEWYNKPQAATDKVGTRSSGFESIWAKL
ncbi:MAG: hypothetical protein P8047_10860 [Gammaproteobacteria bacterium]